MLLVFVKYTVQISTVPVRPCCPCRQIIYSSALICLVSRDHHHLREHLLASAVQWISESVTDSVLNQCFIYTVDLKALVSRKQTTTIIRMKESSSVNLLCQVNRWSERFTLFTLNSIDTDSELAEKLQLVHSKKANTNNWRSSQLVAKERERKKKKATQMSLDLIARCSAHSADTAKADK